MSIYRHTVTKVESMPLGEYLRRAIPFLPSKASVKKALSKDLVKLNGRKCGYFDRVSPGDKIFITRPQRRSPRPAIPVQDIPVIYQDDHCIIVNKPGGIAVNGNRHKTVENVLQHKIPVSPKKDALPFARPVHRLDVPTSGLLILARTKSFQVEIGRGLQNKEVQKQYVAVVHGTLNGEGVIEKPLDGLYCKTQYRVLKTVPSVNFGALTMVHLSPITGRTHQLRKHMKAIGHPIAGDKQYNDSSYMLQGKGMLLCSVSLKFKHPIIETDVNVEIDIPRKFHRVLEREVKFYNKKGRTLPDSPPK